MAENGLEVKRGDNDGLLGGEYRERPFSSEQGIEKIAEKGFNHYEPFRPDTETGPAGKLTPLGMAPDKFQDSLVYDFKRYIKNVWTAISKPKEIFCPQIISMAGGKLQYTLSEDIRKVRAEAYDAGLRKGQKATAKLERYVEGEKAIEIFERGEKKGYNNGFTEGRNERAENMEEALGGFEDLEEYYNKSPDDVVALLGKKFLKVYDWDDEISVYQRRYGVDETRKMLNNCVEKLLDPKRTRPLLPGKRGDEVSNKPIEMENRDEDVAG